MGWLQPSKTRRSVPDARCGTAAAMGRKVMLNHFLPAGLPIGEKAHSVDR
jgi:hypothetical protein